MSNDKEPSILELILSELKEIRSGFNELNTTVAKQEVNLKTHMRRSDELEELVAHIREKEIEPLKTFKARAEGALKLIGGLGVLVALIEGVIKIFS